MGYLFDRYDEEPMRGKDITIGDSFFQVFISLSDEVFCYTGVCKNKKDVYEQSLFVHPYYMTGKHSTDKEISEKVKGFYRIIDGYVTLDDYVDSEKYGTRLYKRLDCRIKFPYPDNYYAIFVNNEEDCDVTRKVFGLTYEEIISLLDAYALTMGTYHEYGSYPRLTRSPRSANYCDITETWIPEGFPYIAFKDSGYDFSHVSLFGFYRHIQLLTGYKIDSVISKALLKHGASEEALERIFNLNICNSYLTKAIKNNPNYD